MSAMCPMCGYALTLDEMLNVGDLSVDPRGIILWKGAKVPLGLTGMMIVAALAREAGRPVSRIALRELIDNDTDSNVIEVHISHARADFKRIDPTFDRIETLRRIGYLWKAT